MNMIKELITPSTILKIHYIHFTLPQNYKKSHWNYVNFIKELYNMDKKFLIDEKISS